MRASRWSFVDWGISMREGIGGKREAKSGAPERDAASRVFDVGAISLCGYARERGVKRRVWEEQPEYGGVSPSTGEA